MIVCDCVWECVSACVYVCVSMQTKPHKTSGKLCQNINTARDKAGSYKLIVKKIIKRLFFGIFLYYFLIHLSSFFLLLVEKTPKTFIQTESA